MSNVPPDAPGVPEPPGGWLPLGPPPGGAPAPRPGGPPAGPYRPPAQGTPVGPPPGYPPAAPPQGYPPGPQQQPAQQRPPGYPPQPGAPQQAAPGQAWGAPAPGWGAPAGQPPQPAPATGAGGVPSFVWPALCLLLFVAAVAASLVAVNNSHNGSDWKTRAGSAEALVATLQKQYNASEAESKRLEGRTTVLAHEKADAQDKLAVRAVLPADVKAVASALENCSNGTRSLLESIAGASSQSEFDALQGRAIEVAGVCDQAQTSAQGLVDFLRSQATK